MRKMNVLRYKSEWIRTFRFENKDEFMRPLVNMWDTLLDEGRGLGGVLSMIISIRANGLLCDTNSIGDVNCIQKNVQRNSFG